MAADTATAAELNKTGGQKFSCTLHAPQAGISGRSHL